MLTGRAFFADREDGNIWCDSCVPTAVVLLGGGTVATGTGRGRYVVVEAGELIVQHILPRNSRPLRIRARCCECGVVQPAGDVR
jgi:hypothetical protein